MTDSVLNPCTVDVIWFDFGGVLAEEGFREGLRAIAEGNGLEPEAFIETGFDLVYEGGYVTGRSDEKTFWEAMRQKTGMHGTDELLRNFILSHFELRTWMIELIKKLRQSNMRLGILSDHTNWLDELDAMYDFFKWFDHVFNSYHVGKSKRDPSLFDDLLALMNIKPDKVLFVDDYHGNVERAKQKGLHALLYEDRLNFLDDLARFCPFIRQTTEGRRPQWNPPKGVRKAEFHRAGRGRMTDNRGRD